VASGTESCATVCAAVRAAVCAAVCIAVCTEVWGIDQIYHRDVDVFMLYGELVFSVVLGRSIVIHGSDYAAGRLACADIQPSSTDTPKISFYISVPTGPFK